MPPLQVDDREPAEPQRGVVVAVRPLVVGASVGDPRHHRRQDVPRQGPTPSVQAAPVIPHMQSPPRQIPTRSVRRLPHPHPVSHPGSGYGQGIPRVRPAPRDGTGPGRWLRSGTDPESHWLRFVARGRDHHRRPGSYPVPHWLRFVTTLRGARDHPTGHDSSIRAGPEMELVMAFMSRCRPNSLRFGDRPSGTSGTPRRPGLASRPRSGRVRDDPRAILPRVPLASFRTRRGPGIRWGEESCPESHWLRFVAAPRAITLGDAPRSPLTSLREMRDGRTNRDESFLEVNGGFVRRLTPTEARRSSDGRTAVGSMAHEAFSVTQKISRGAPHGASGGLGGARSVHDNRPGPSAGGTPPPGSSAPPPPAPSSCPDASPTAGRSR